MTAAPLRPLTTLHRRWLTACLAIVMCPLASAAAQESTGGIRGIVTDNTNAVLVGVTVEAASPARIGGAAVDVTNAQGLYRIEGLPLGTYTVTFTLQGFTTIRRENVRVEVGRTMQVDIQLQVGGVEQSVTVTAESPVVDALHSGYTTSFNRELIENIPTSRSSWFDTISYAPGIKADLVTGNTANFVIYGASTEQNSYQVNGIEVFSPSGSIWDFPSPDMAEEIAVVGVGASAEVQGLPGRRRQRGDEKRQQSDARHREVRISRAASSWGTTRRTNSFRTTSTTRRTSRSSSEGRSGRTAHLIPQAKKRPRKHIPGLPEDG